jgi:hypothetical protein
MSALPAEIDSGKFDLTTNDVIEASPDLAQRLARSLAAALASR